MIHSSLSIAKFVLRYGLPFRYSVPYTVPLIISETLKQKSFFQLDRTIIRASSPDCSIKKAMDFGPNTVADVRVDFFVESSKEPLI